MGAWGPRLYQDDIAEEVRYEYKDQLHRGKTGKEITQELIAKNEYVIADQDDGPVFWFALADTQWNLGRLEDFVKENALNHIREGSDIRRWEQEDPKDAKVRAKTLEALRQKLLSPQPPEKKISQYRLYRCEWKIGDVYAYRLEGEYAQENGMDGKYLYFVKVDEDTWHPGHIVPIVYFYWTIEDRLLSLDEIKGIDYIPQFYSPDAYKKYPDFRKLYILLLLNTSSRVIPKKRLTFIGNIGEVKRMENEDLNEYYVRWKDFDKYIINNFKNWEEYQPRR